MSNLSTLVNNVITNINAVRALNLPPLEVLKSHAAKAKEELSVLRGKIIATQKALADTRAFYISERKRWQQEEEAAEASRAQVLEEHTLALQDAKARKVEIENELHAAGKKLHKITEELRVLQRQQR
jgi:hypothetical protein